MSGSSRRPRVAITITICCIRLAAVARAGDTPPDLLTVAETSDYRATARHAQVLELCDRLAAAFPAITRGTLGLSGEGRELPLLIVADPPVALPPRQVAIAREPSRAGNRLTQDDRLLVFIIANIHSGECDGKEAMLMLARELGAATTGGKRDPILDHLILAICPIYNADGNEQVSTTNRPGQVGPAEGMGRRENAAGLDLNRDFIKLEASETRALVAFLNRFDPAVFIDCHTTNGCFHRYQITYEGPKNPAGDLPLLRYCRDRLMPEIAAHSERDFGVPAFVYGDFNREHTRWDTYPAHGRYGTTYVGLRNRISILVESYSYDTYKARIIASRDYVRASLNRIAANRLEIRAALTRADESTTLRQPAEVALRTRAIAAPQRIAARGFIEEQRDGRTISTGVAKDYDVESWTHFEPTLQVTRPAAYLIPPGLTAVAEKLREHGVRVETLSADSETAVETYTIDKAAFAETPFQKHRTLKVEATAKPERARFAAGTFVVPLDQPLGTLAAYLLEPQCEDGLLTWNFFDEYAKPGTRFPVSRVVEPHRLSTNP